MFSLTAHLIVRGMRLAPVVACVFAGCTCNGKPAPAPLPTAPANAPAPTRAQPAAAAAKPTEAAPPAAAAVATGGAPEGSPAPAAPDDAAAKARRALCERYVAALSGRGEEAALLKNPEVLQFASRTPDLVTCAAVTSDSQAVCDPLVMTLENGQRQYPTGAKDCIYLQAMFHEARTYPNGRSFMFTKIDRQQCQDAAVCDTFQEAMRAADEAKCGATGQLQSICRAFIKLDKSLCRFEGKVPNAGDKDYGKEEGPAEFCTRTIDERAFFAKGLKALADSGPPRERALASAALGQADACKSIAGAAVDSCVAEVIPPQMPVPATPAGPPPAGTGEVPTPVAGTPVPATRVPTGAPPQVGRWSGSASRHT